MDPRDLFRGFFGFSGWPQNSSERDWNLPDDDIDENPRRRPPNEDEPGLNFHLDVFTNPLEMHRFFDQQMDQVLRSFGLGQGFGGFGFSPSPFGRGATSIDEDDEARDRLPSLREDPSEEASAGSREFMLKDGFGFSPAHSAGEDKRDKDLDNNDASKSLELYPSKQKPSTSVEPFRPSSSWLSPFFEMPHDRQSPNFHFSSSTTHKIVIQPDGSVDHHITKRNSDGHEKATVTRSVGDKSHTVTTVRKPDGSEERTEQFVNMSESENAWKSEASTTKTLFDKFFGSY